MSKCNVHSQIQPHLIQLHKQNPFDIPYINVIEGNWDDGKKELKFVHVPVSVRVCACVWSRLNLAKE